MTVAPSSQPPHQPEPADGTVTTRRLRRVPPPPHMLRELRLIKGWSLNDLAARSGLHKAVISQIERGRMVATQAEADRRAQALGYPAGALQTKPMLFLVEGNA